MENLVDEIVNAVKVGYNLAFVKIGRVKSLAGLGKVNLTIDKKEFKNVRYFGENIPMVGADTIVVFADNSDLRAYAVAFSQYSEASNDVGGKAKMTSNPQETSIEREDNKMVMNDSKTELSKGDNAVTMEESVMQIKKGDAFIKFEDGKIIIDGEVEFKKKVKMEDELTCEKDVSLDEKLSVAKEISSDEDVKAGTISLKMHTHTGNLGAPTSPPS